MKCSSPLYRIDATKPGFLRLPSKFQVRRRNDGVFLRLDEVSYLTDLRFISFDHVQTICCGQCFECRMKRSREWAVRCMHEASLHDTNYFVTLTYNDWHLPIGEFLSSETPGEVVDVTLRRCDVVSFIKRYREYERRTFGNTNIKVFYCGEYGDLTKRPHYHVILFGITPLSDRYLWRKKDNFLYYRSSVLEDLWSDKYGNIGNVEFSDVSFETCAYTARYVLKKQLGESRKEILEYAETVDLPLQEEPFIGMSRRPGIGKAYYDLHKGEIYDDDSVQYQRQFKLFSSKPPRYYDKLYDIDDPLDMAFIKANRSAFLTDASNFDQDHLLTRKLREEAKLADERRVL